jgi:membrane-bound lytic murein transglycosylase B
VIVGLVVTLVATREAAARDAERGWGFLVEKLVADGVPRDRALRVFRDDRVDEFDGLYFSLEPRESHSLYRHLRTYDTAARMRRCLDEHRTAFEAAERRYGVPALVVASIIQVESGCGRNTGRSRILPALARLAMAAEPENLERNIERHTLLNQVRGPGNVSSFARWRASHLENVFYPEVLATFTIADRMHVDPLEIRGSGSGAFGIPQFLPRSYLWFGVDGDGDGHVSLYYPEDAIPSCAHYLQQFGWRPELSLAERRNVVWGYNHSDAYIDTVLWLAGEVETPAVARSRVATRRRPAARSTRSAARRSAVRKASRTTTSSKPIATRAKKGSTTKARTTKTAPKGTAKTAPKALPKTAPKATTPKAATKTAPKKSAPAKTTSSSGG